MNRYLTEGICRDAVNGLRVVVIGRRRTWEPALLEIESQVGFAPGVVVRKSNGAEVVKFPSGGEVVFRTSNRPALDGIQFDVALLEEAADRRGELLQVLTVARHKTKEPGEIVRF